MAVKQQKRGKGRAASATRRLLVGTNVAVTVVLLIGIVGTLQWFVQLRPARLDMTSRGINSLSEASERLLRGLDADVRLTSLYFETDRETEDQARYRRSVDDVLALYQSMNRSRIAAQWVNPLKDNEKYQKVLARLRAMPQYKSQIDQYVEAIDRFRGDLLGQMDELLRSELMRLGELNTTGSGLGETRQPLLAPIENALMQLNAQLDRHSQDIEAEMTGDQPRHAAVVNEIRSVFRTFSQSLPNITAFAQRTFVEAPTLSPEEKEYLTGISARYESVIQQVSEESALVDALEPLDVDGLIRQLGQTNNAILVEAKGEAVVVDFPGLWPPLRQGAGGRQPGFKDRAFKGEEKLTLAVLRATHKEQTPVVFVRYGGPPLFFGGFMPGQPPAPFAMMKTQLEEANFIVLDWDVKTSRQPPKLEAELAKPIYVVLKPAPPQRNPMGQPSADKPFDPSHKKAVLDAVNASGRALFIAGWSPGPFGPIPSTYEFGQYLKDTWGIEVDTSALLLRMISVAPGKYQFAPPRPILMTDLEVSEHAIVSGSSARQMFLPWCAPLNLTDPPAEGVVVSKLVTQPKIDGVWGARNVQKYQEQGGKEFVLKVEDDPEGPFLLAAAGVRDDHKVVVVSAQGFAQDDIAFARGLDLRTLSFRSRNPGNVTLFVNSLHWLNDNTQFMDMGKPIDATVLEIQDRSTERMVQGLTIFGWPVIALLCGGVVWWTRRG